MMRQLLINNLKTTIELFITILSFIPTFLMPFLRSKSFKKQAAVKSPNNSVESKDESLSSNDVGKKKPSLKSKFRNSVKKMKIVNQSAQPPSISESDKLDSLKSQIEELRNQIHSKDQSIEHRDEILADLLTKITTQRLVKETSSYENNLSCPPNSRRCSSFNDKPARISAQDLNENLADLKRQIKRYKRVAELKKREIRRLDEQKKRLKDNFEFYYNKSSMSSVTSVSFETAPEAVKSTSTVDSVQRKSFLSCDSEFDTSKNLSTKEPSVFCVDSPVPNHQKVTAMEDQCSEESFCNDKIYLTCGSRPSSEGLPSIVNYPFSESNECGSDEKGEKVSEIKQILNNQPVEINGISKEIVSENIYPSGDTDQQSAFKETSVQTTENNYFQLEAELAEAKEEVNKLRQLLLVTHVSITNCCQRVYPKFDKMEGLPIEEEINLKMVLSEISAVMLNVAQEHQNCKLYQKELRRKKELKKTAVEKQPLIVSLNKAQSSSKI